MGARVNPVGWFEIPVTDMARGKAFYEYVFELELEDEQMGAGQMATFPMSWEESGTSGALVKGEGYVPSREGVLVYFTAPDIEATLARAREKGGVVLSEKMNIGKHGFVASIKDPEGNRVMLHSRT
jgi:predicted enzyme related to lactoylglutathione lyase